MLLSDSDLEQYREEIRQLYQTYLREDPKGMTYFAILGESELQAVASLKNYSGNYYLRGCVVKLEFRGRGLQRTLIRERLEFLVGRMDTVRVSVFPENKHSIRNIEAEGFTFEKTKEIDRRTANVYKKQIPTSKM